MFWTKINTRLTTEELRKESSLSKAVYVLFPVLVYYLIKDITEVILWAIINLALNGASEDILNKVSSMSGTLQGVIYGISLLVVLAVLRKCATNEITFKEDEKAKNNMSFLQILFITAVSLGVSIGLNYLFSFIGFTSSSQQFSDVSNSQFDMNFYSGLILYGIVSPFAEEVIFRGILYNRIKRMFPIALSVAVSALLFGLYHGNIVQGVYGTLMGLLIIFFYERYKTFMAPLIFHSVANLGVYVVTYVLWR